MKLKAFVLLALLTTVTTAQESITWKEKYMKVIVFVIVIVGSEAR